MNRINVQSLVFALGLVSCGMVSASALRDCNVICDTTTACENALKARMKPSKELFELKKGIVDILAPMQAHLQGLKEGHSKGRLGSWFGLRPVSESDKREIDSALWKCRYYTPIKEELMKLVRGCRFNANLLKYAGRGYAQCVWVECDDKNDPIWALRELPFDNVKALVDSSKLAPVSSCNVFDFPFNEPLTGKESLSDYIDVKAKKAFAARIAIDRNDQSKFLVEIRDQQD